MTRNEFKKICKAEKTAIYKLQLIGGILNAVGCVITGVGALLLIGDSYDLHAAISICAAGLATLLCGDALVLIGEAMISVYFRKYQNGESEAVFNKVMRKKKFTLENQNGKTERFSETDLFNYLEDMFDSPEQFVTLTAPAAKQRIRFIQACMQDGMVEVQLGFEGKETSLFHKLCSRDECLRIFSEFRKGTFVPYIGEYTPVRF